jgi:cytochrome P450
VEAGLFLAWAGIAAWRSCGTGGRVLEPFAWLGYVLERQDWVLLDVYGTNHDARLWPEPEQFMPERFREWRGDPYTLIPQGGGAFETGHRCPGEWLTIALIKKAVRQLSDTRYSVPDQDLSQPPQDARFADQRLCCHYRRWDRTRAVTI